MSQRRPILLYLPGAKTLAERSWQILGEIGRGNWKLIPFEVKYFTDGEVKVMLPTGEENSVRGADTYVMQVIEYGYPHTRQDVFFELVGAVATLTECEALYRTAITPWYAYACQDKPRRREPITARLAADILTVAGATRVLSVDVHNDATKGFFDRQRCSFMGLYASGLLLQYLQAQSDLSLTKDNFVISGVDQGSGARVKHLAKHTGLMPVLPSKIKDYQTGTTTEIIIREPIEGKAVIIFDDMIRTSSSIVETAEALITKGATKVIMATTHANLCGPAIAELDRLYQEDKLVFVLCTDSFNFPDDFSKQHPWLRQLSLAGMITQTIANLHEEKPVGHLYLDDRML